MKERIIHSEDEQRLEQNEYNQLLRKLENLQKRRRQVRQLLEQDVTIQMSQLCDRYNELSLEHSRALQDYQLEIQAKRNASQRLKVSQKWNVTNDCFFIWHRGPFGTINGLRLGSEVPFLPSDPDEPVVKPVNTGQRSILGYSLGLSGEAPLPPPADSCKVPWVEINSALGMVALLLSTLERKPHNGISYRNEVVALGSTSKIGIKGTYYNLFSDDSFQLFGKRNFNIALNGLLQCVADAAEAVLARDRTIALPHPIQVLPRGECKIAGLSVAFGLDGERWTRAMKYLLTDLKWLVAFTTKHVDR